MTLRDFSEAAKTDLLSIIKKHEDEIWSWWIFSALADLIGDAFISEDISSYGGDIKKYQDSIIDKKNTSAEQLNKIWENVYAVDATYEARAVALTDQARQLSDVYLAQAEIINPAPASGKKMPFLLSEADYQAQLAALRSLGEAWKQTYLTRDIERQNDLRMQEEIDELLKAKGYTNDKWNAMTEAEKLAALEALIPEINRILGSNIDEATVNTMHEPPDANGLITVAFYSPATNQMTINLAALNDPSLSAMMLQTIVHETRHAYQWETVSKPGSHIVSPETQSRWDWNFQPGNYRNGIQDPDETAAGIVDDYNAYVSQPLEYDAFSFAHNGLNNVTPVYPGSWI